MNAVDRPTFVLNALGGFQLLQSGRNVDVPTRKVACLLTYLVCTSPAPQPREKLATLLWGSSNDERARHNLRQALSAIRKLLGTNALVSEGEGIRLARDLVDCDAVRLRTLSEDQSPAAVAAAAALYEGPLLETISVNEVAWADWLSRERERLSEFALSAMVQHGVHELGAGRAQAALQLGQKAVRLNSFREDAHRLVLNSLSAIGRTSEAVKYFQDLVSHLKAELDTEPDEETRMVFVRLAGKGGADGPAVTQARGGELAIPAEPEETFPTRPAEETGSCRREAEPRLSQRRQVTILVCGLAGQPGASRTLDPEVMGALVTEFRKSAMETAERFDGYVAPSSPDLLRVYFGFPEAREQDAIEAVRCAGALVDAAAGIDAVREAGMLARAGIATGVVVAVADSRDKSGGRCAVIGEAPARAAELLSLAAPGEIVVAASTRPLIARRFELRGVRDAGRGQAAGQPEAWQVCGERDELGQLEARSRDLLPPLVGRQEELDLLMRRWEQAKEGSGRVVLVSGEPGIGKSRLTEDFLQGLEAERATCLRYHCSPHHNVRPLHPYITRIETDAGLASAKTPAEKQDRLADWIGAGSPDRLRDAALLAEVMSLPADARYPLPAATPFQKREMVFAGLLECLERMAKNGPIAIVFEDLHWIDPTSLELLDRTISRIAGLPVLLIVTMRSEYQPVWIGQPHVTMLYLNRLGREESSGIVAGITRGRPLPKPVVARIVAQANGVPLFVSELTKHLVDSGPIEETDDRYRSDPFLRSYDIPTTLQSSLIARLDRLGSAREVALVGAAIGRKFSCALLAAVLKMDHDELAAALQRMTESGLVSRTGVPPHESYSFNHILMRDAAYGMMLKDRRKRLHSQIADELTRNSAKHSETSPETIAHHLAEAGRSIEAVPYWVEASRLAQKRWSNRESADYLGSALSALGGQPDSPETLRQAIDLRFEIKNALTPLGEFSRIIDHLLEARELIDSLGDPTRLCRFYMHMCQTLSWVGRSVEAIGFGEDGRKLATALGNEQMLVEVLVFLGRTHVTMMNYRRAERHFLEVLELMERGPSDRRFDLEGFPDIAAGAYLARICGVLGRFDEGIGFGEAAMRRATELDQPYSLSVALWCLADLRLGRGELAEAIPLFEKGLEISRRWDLPFLVAGHSGSLGHALALSGRSEEGLPLLESAIAVFDKMSHKLALSLFLVPLGQASLLAGRLEQAAELARRAMTLAIENGHPGGDPGALHILAEVAAREDRFEEARELFASAHALAGTLDMRPVAARCRHGVGKLYLRAGEPDRAQASLDTAARMYKDMGMRFWLDQMNAGLSG